MDAQRAGGLTHCQIHCNIGRLPWGRRFPD